MNLFEETHQQLIKELLQAGVEFIIIGGYSVIFHGYARTTGDIDLWLRPDNSNKEKLLVVLKNFGFDADDIKEIAALDFTKHTVFSFGEEPRKVDFITHINLVNFAEAEKEKVIADLEGLKVPFLHLNHLILSKINTGRSQDKADIDRLQQIEKARNKKR